MERVVSLYMTPPQGLPPDPRADENGAGGAGFPPALAGRKPAMRPAVRAAGRQKGRPPGRLGPTLLVAFLAAGPATAAGGGRGKLPIRSVAPSGSGAALPVTSPAFEEGGPIP